MMRRLEVAILSSALPLLGGCVMPRPETVVQLINNTDFVVRVRLFYHDNQLYPRALIEELGQELNFTIPAGATRSFGRDCYDVQAIFIENAELVIVGDVGPSRDTRVYHDGTDFACGDTLVFSFTQPALPTELNIAFSIQ
jgi:hypothetical protein